MRSHVEVMTWIDITCNAMGNQGLENLSSVNLNFATSFNTLKILKKAKLTPYGNWIALFKPAIMLRNYHAQEYEVIHRYIESCVKDINLSNGES